MTTYIGDRDSAGSEEAEPRLDDGGPCNLVGFEAEDGRWKFRDVFLTFLVLAALALGLFGAARYWR
ncbi:hypothetical protein [Paludisphaera mucosa]|uniref:Uncharacterized protein n=1 Tax=Paludisphaera mucosa TaxID=3030827 RepID=A0ABT6FB46_9BACT|nr:hypothetical protein [Paludisphaera mucosa]MDG3004797.1 hypothetical protein [Paludisphaera mucosa]